MVLNSIKRNKKEKNKVNALADSIKLTFDSNKVFWPATHIGWVELVENESN